MEKPILPCVDYPNLLTTHLNSNCRRFLRTRGVYACIPIFDRYQRFPREPMSPAGDGEACSGGVRHTGKMERRNRNGISLWSQS